MSSSTENRRGVEEEAHAASVDPDPIARAGFLSDLALKLRRLSIGLWGERRALEMVGQSASLLDLQAKMEKVARFREPVLITGESGVGKEQLAQAIYLLSDRKGKPYVSVNCPQYQEGNLTVSELFGHRKGSFTGAIEDRKGAFEAADGGVIFLDEIGDLHKSAQSLLLRALATGEFKPVGSDRARSADVRVVAATNRPLNRLRMAQDFRDDLFFRLQYFYLRVGPLRERGDDWRLLLDYMLVKLRQKYGVSKRFSAASLKLLETYNWPGNTRQLIAVATMGYAMADGDRIEPGDFSAEIEVSGDARDSAELLYQRIVEDGAGFWEVIYQPFMERDLNRREVKLVIQRGLQATQGNYRKLMDVLHMPASDYQKWMDFLRHHKLKA